MGVRRYGDVDFLYGEGGHLYGELGVADLTDYVHGSFYGSVHLGNSFKAGSRSIYAPVVFPLQGKGYKIIFYDKTGLKVGEISSEIQNSPLINASFELLTNGCGAFEILLSQLPKELEDIDYNYRVDIHLFGDENPWYSGYILHLPEEGTTEIGWEYSGFGYYNQLNNKRVNRSYENKQVSYIVRDIISTIIEPETDIVYDALKIEATFYEVKSIRWDRAPAKEVMKRLSELALGYEFGVDEERDFFFRQKDTAINEDARFWVGKHLGTFVSKKDVEPVRNRLFIHSGKVTGAAGAKTNYVCTVEDVGSIAAYDVREDSLTMPAVLENADAQQWGNYKLTELKDPVQTGKITGIEVFKRRINAKGKAKITSLNGLHSYELPIKKVKYKISSEGIVVNVDLGKKDVSFSAEQLRLAQKVITNEQLEEQKMRQG